MATRTGQNFRGRLTDIHRDNCIRDLYERVEALQTAVEELNKATSNPNGESSSTSVHNLSNDSWKIFPMNQSNNSFNVSLMQGMLKTYHRTHAKMISPRKSN